MSGTYSGSDKRLAYLFENGGGGGGGSSTLAGLDDVNLSSPTDGQVLKYDATNDEWVNGGGGSGGGDIYLNTIYSETEEKIGYWTDGKPLYQKTLIYNQSYTYATGNWGEIPFSNVPANIERVRIFDVEQLDSSGDVYFDNRVRYFYSNSKIYGISTQSQHIVAGLIITIQYTKTTDTPEVPQRGNAIYLPTIYSEEEREVGVWKDGKPLYQKTIAFSTAISGVQTINHGISNLDTVVEVTGAVHDDYEKPSWIPDPRIAQDGNNIGVSNVYPTSITIYVPTVFGSRIHKGHITIQYTKTTDSAGSGSWTPSGAPAVHYSTNEQVVGTWIDGKTLYQKTITPSIAEIQSHTYTDSDFANADVMLLMDGYYVLTDNYLKVPLNQFETGSYYTRTGFRTDKSVYLYAIGYAVTGNAVITVRYTKTS